MSDQRLGRCAAKVGPSDAIALELGVAKSSVSRWVADIDLSPAQHALLTSNDPLHPRRTNGAAVKRSSALEVRRRAQAAGRGKAAAGSALHGPSKASRWRRFVLLYGTARVAVHSTEIVQSSYGAIQAYGGFEREAWAA